jgi:phage nucleotide-binding protein
MLLYGDPGVGKTHLCGTAMDHPGTAPVLYLDVDGGVTTLRNRQDLDVLPVRSIDGVDNTDGINQIYEKLFASITKDDKGARRLEHYNTVVIDRLDELADVDMRYIMRAAYARNPDKVDVDVPSPREYGINRSHIRKLVRAFRDLPCHVIFVAGVAARQEEGQPTKYFPGFSGKLQTEVPGFCDIVGYYYNDNSTGEVVRRLQFQGTRRVQAKDRTDSLDEFIDDPSIPLMWNLIHPPAVSKKAAA